MALDQKRQAAAAAKERVRDEEEQERQTTDAAQRFGQHAAHAQRDALWRVQGLGGRSWNGAVPL